MLYSTQEFLGYLLDTPTAHKLFKAALSDGGGTVYHSGNDRKYGYIVGSAAPYSVKIDMNRLDEVMLDVVKSFVADVSDVGVGIGSWIDDDLMYFDAVEWTDSLSYAMKLAEERDELAIYDIENSKALRM